MNPFSPGQDVFQTQADQRFNSFSSPMNPMNQNSGDWGMNANYMTPSYTSPYRPRYTGPNGNQNSGYKPGFAKSVNHIFNPFEGGGTNYGGNSYGQNSSYYDQIGMRPIDAGMGAMQSLVIPTAVAMGTFKAFTGLGTSMGHSFGAGLGGALGKGFGATAAGNMAAGMGAVGGFAGGIMIPMAIAQGVTSAVDKTFFEPYTAQRSTADALRRNTFGITYGDGGNSVTGGGMSRKNAAGQAGSISSMAARDTTFSQMEISQLTDYAGRSGMLDNTAGSQMASRMKEITRQVKTVMAVANTSDFKEAIEIMAKLQSSGVGSQRMSGTMGAIGGLASAAGMSTQRLMNTVGAQGQYLYGANGLTPYVGQLTAGAAAASFGSAYRSGLMSPALMARMGGVEGASQSANSGLLSALQSPYSTIMGMNAMHGGSSGSIVGNMSMFGGHASRNSAENIGMMNLLAPSLTSHMAETQGMGQVNRMLRQLGANSPGMMKNGRMGAGSAYSLLTQTLGIGDTEARAMLEQMRANQDPDTRKTAMAGFDRSRRDFILKFADQNSMNKGIFTKPYNNLMENVRKVGEFGSNAVAGLNYGVASATDRLEKHMYGALYGDAITPSSFNEQSGSHMEFGSAKHDIKNILNESMMLANNTSGGVSDINKSIRSGDKDAIALVGAKSKFERLIYINALAEKGVIAPKYKQESHAALLSSMLESSGTVSVKYNPSSAENRVKSAYKKTGGSNSILRDAEMISVAQKLEKNPTDINLINRMSELKTGKRGNLTPQQLKEVLEDTARFSATYGTYDGGDIYNSMAKELGMDSTHMDVELSKKGGLERISKKLGITGARSISELYTKYSSKVNKTAVGAQLDPSKTGALTHDAAIAFGETMKGIDDQRAKLQSLYSSGVVDFSQYTAGVNSLDNKEANLSFGTAVDRFGIYVEAVVSGKSISAVTKNRDDAAAKMRNGG